MHKTKLIQVFYALSRQQQKQLCLFVESPFYNHRKDVRDLCAYLHKKGNADRDNLHKDKVFDAVFGGKIDEKKLYYASSFLLKLIENYLITEHLQSNELHQQIALAQAYSQLRIDGLFEATIAQAKAAQQKNNLRDASFYATEYELEWTEYLHTVQQERNAPRNLQPLDTALDVHYIAQKLRQACRMMAHQSVFKVQYDTGLADSVLAYVSSRPDLQTIPAIGLYYFNYQLLKTQEETQAVVYLRQFKDMLLGMGQHFSAQETRDLYVLAVNQCIKWFNKTGKEEYAQDMFEVYRAGLEGNYLLEDGKISPFAFKNIAGVAMRLRQLDWAENFIEQYTPLLPEKDRATYSDYSRSKLYFNKKQYKEAMTLLQKVEYSDIFLNLDAKIMLLKMYYELGEYDVLDALLHSFQHFLNRKEQLGYHRENYSNTLRFVKKLLNIAPQDKDKKTQLKTEIEQTAALGERNWLLEQLLVN